MVGFEENKEKFLFLYRSSIRLIFYFFPYFRETRVFEGWSNESLQALCLDSRVNQHSSNSVIAANYNTESEWLYLCLEVKVIKISFFTNPFLGNEYQ